MERYAMKQVILSAVVLFGVASVSLPAVSGPGVAQAAVVAQGGDGGQQQSGGQQQQSSGQQADGGQQQASPLDTFRSRISGIDGMISQGDCNGARDQLRALLNEGPDALERAGVTLAQMRELMQQLDDVMYRAGSRC